MFFFGVSTPSIDEIQAIMTLTLSTVAMLGLFAGVGFAIWQYQLYKKLLASEKSIHEKQDELDNVEPDVNGRTSGHLVNEAKRVAMVDKERAPKLRELERLREERDFIKDKLLFAKK